MAYGVAVASDNEAIAVMLDLMHPVGPGRRLDGAGRDAGLDEAVGAGRHHDLVLSLRTVVAGHFLRGRLGSACRSRTREASSEGTDLCSGRPL